MSPLAPIGLGMYTVGSGLDVLGQVQGTNSMRRQAERQQHEQEAYLAARRGEMQGEINRRTASPAPIAATAGATNQAQRALNAVNPAAAAGGKALGVSAAPAMSSAYPAITLGGYQAGQRGVAQGNDVALQGLGQRIGIMDQTNQRNMSLYNQRMQMSAMKGGGYRDMGQTLQQYGMGMMSLGMAQPGSTPSGGGGPGPISQTGLGSMQNDPELSDPMGSNEAYQRNLNVQRYLTQR